MNPLVLIAYIAQVVLLIGTPLVIGFWLIRRYGIPWMAALIGAAVYTVGMFVRLFLLSFLFGGSQIPVLNANLIQILLDALIYVVGIWVALKFFAKDVRDVPNALMFALGIGGTEPIMQGIQIIPSLFMIVQASMSGDYTGFQDPEAAAAEAQLFWSQSPLLPFLQYLRYLSLILIFAVMVVMIVRSFKARETQKRNLWFVGAFVLHVALMVPEVLVVLLGGTDTNTVVLLIFGVMVARTLIPAFIFWKLADDAFLNPAPQGPPEDGPQRFPTLKLPGEPGFEESVLDRMYKDSDGDDAPPEEEQEEAEAADEGENGEE